MTSLIEGICLLKHHLRSIRVAALEQRVAQVERWAPGARQ